MAECYKGLHIPFSSEKDVGLAMFDMDGTVIDSMDDLVGAVNRTRGRFGLAALSRERVCAAVGDGRKALTERTIPPEELDIPLDDKLAVMVEEYNKGLLYTTKLYPGFPKIFDTLVSHGWKLAVLSNKPLEAVRIVLDGLGISDYFAYVLGGAPGFPLKPDPACVELVVANCAYNGPRDNIWMIGDNHTDLEVGRRAGVKRCFCNYGYGTANGEPFDLELADISDFFPLASFGCSTL